jgi:hypothetical protein
MKANGHRGAGRPVNVKGKAKFLRLYPQCGTVELAAKQVPVTRPTVYNWIHADAEFAKKVDDIKPVAKNVFLGALEEEARRRAVEGIDEPVFYKGVLVNHVKKYSDTLLMFLLNGAAPEKYRQRIDTDITSKGNEIKPPVNIYVIDAETKELMGKIAERTGKQIGATE